MPKGRKIRVPLHMRAVGAGGALLVDLCERAAKRPVDFVAVVAAVAVSTVVVVNALYLQRGSRSARYFTPPLVAAPGSAGGTASRTVTAQVTGTTPARPAEQTIATHPIANAATAPQPVSVRRDDPIADLIAPQPSPRVTAVQRALSEYGYGQIKLSGVLDEPTMAAIEKFEREHKMPVTGRISERLVSQLTVLVGHALD